MGRPALSGAHGPFLSAVEGRVLASTTSHKREPLLPVLEVFARLGLRDLDLNLHHLIETGVPVDAVAQSVAANGLRLWILSGGWCDFFHRTPEIERTFASVDRQVALADALGVSSLRLFFGRLAYAEYSDAAADTAAANLMRLSDRHPARSTSCSRITMARRSTRMSAARSSIALAGRTSG